MTKIDEKYAQLGGENGFLGKPIGDEKGSPEGSRDPVGSFRLYKNGSIYSSKRGVHEVHGPIFKHWEKLKFEKGFLGYPMTDERQVSDGIGRYNEFERGVIYWSPATGAHEVRDETGHPFLDKWRVLGGPRGVLGYPMESEKELSGGDKAQAFEKGVMLQRKGKSPFGLHGEIFKQWQVQDKIGSGLGFPVSDELPSSQLNTRSVKFEKGILQRTAPPPPMEVTENVPEVLPVHDILRPDLKSKHEQHRKNGFRIVSLSVYGDPADPLYTCVWSKEAGPEQRVLFKASRKELQDFLGDPENKDFQAEIISATGPVESAVFALVCEKKKGAAPVVRSQLLAGPIDGAYTPDTFAYWCQWAKGAQYILRSAAIYGSPKSPRYAGVWEINRNEVPWNVAYHDVNKKIATNFLAELPPTLFETDEMGEITHAQTFWARPAFITRSPHGHELRVFRADRVVDWASRGNRSLEEYLSDLKDFSAKKFFPVSLQGSRVAGKSRFAIVFAKRVKPQPRKFRATGKPRPGLIAFDDAMEDMMRQTGARAASLAIAKGGKLKYARAFTWAEADEKDVQPTDVFRIASCSKPVTSVGVYQWLEPKPDFVKPSLATSLKSQVKLTLPKDRSEADNFDDIELGHLLAHRAGFQKQIEHDEDIRPTFDERGKEKQLPLTMAEVASYMATVKLVREPGEEFVYSNVGFLFLCLLLEQKLKKPYEQAMQERIFAKVGVKRARITENSPDLKPDEVIALDRQLRVGRSVMSKERPIVPHEYGTVNRDTRPGTGGWVMAPADYVRFLSVLHSGDGTLLSSNTVKDAVRIDKHGGGIDGAVAHVEHMKNGFTFAVFFAINFLGEFEMRIRDIINALPESAWPADDQFPDALEPGGQK